MSDEITIPKHTAQILFDALVHSMDFGSGFLDTEEVDALRAMAGVLGVDPAIATPATFVKEYPHPFKPMDVRSIELVYGIVDYAWRDRSALGLPPGLVTVRHGETVEIGYVPCTAGAFPYCKKPETDPVHRLDH